MVRLDCVLLSALCHRSTSPPLFVICSYRSPVSTLYPVVASVDLCMDSLCMDYVTLIIVSIKWLERAAPCFIL